MDQNAAGNPNVPAFRRLGSGPSVVLLHGVPGSGRTWDAVANRLSLSHDVLVPDLLGFGASPHRTSLEDLHAGSQASALEALLDQIGVSRTCIVGHDFGGPVALILAARRPDLISHLGLLATNAFTDTPIPFPLSVVNWPILGGLAAPLMFSRPSLAMMIKIGTGKPRNRLNPAIYLGDKAQARSIRTIFQGSLANLRDLYAPVEAALHSVQVPSVVAWGDKDPFFPVAQGDRTARALGARFEVYAGAGHFLPEERPDEVSTLIRELTKVPIGAR